MAKVKNGSRHCNYRDDNFELNRSGISELNNRIQSLRDKCQAGWGQKYQDRVHAKGKLTAWERIEALKDADSCIFQLEHS